VVASREVRLGDVLVVEGLEPGQTQPPLDRVIATAPMVGQTLRIDRARLREALAQTGWAAAAQWTGAAVVNVVRETRRVETEPLCRSAIEALRAAATPLPEGGQLELQCAGGVQPPALPVGALVLQVLQPTRPVDGLQDVALELRVDGLPQRVVKVPVRAQLTAPQWCAREGVAAGQALAAQHFNTCRQPLRHAAQWQFAGQPLPAGRLKRALRAGEPLQAGDVLDAGLQLRGDSVTVVYRSSGLTLESPARLTQDARIGDSVSVQLQGANQALSGRLVAAHLVEVGNSQ